MNNEIDIIIILKKVVLKKRIIFKYVFIFLFAGLIFVTFNKNEYSASSTILPLTESNKAIGGNISGLAAMAGINLEGNGDESGISPVLYPQIIGSLPFQRKLLETKLSIIGQSEKVTYRDYYSTIYKPSLFFYIKKYTIGLPKLLMKSLSSKSPDVFTSKEVLSISEDEFMLLKTLVKQVSVSTNPKEGFIRVSVKMPEAIAAAQMTKSVEKLLQTYIINYKSDKATEQLRFIEERYVEKQNEFVKLQNKLALFKDKNRNVSSLLAKTKLEQIQAQYDLVFGVYSELAKQLEKQKIQVKKVTPIFTILKPVTIPIYKSNTSKITVLIFWGIIGAIFGVLKIFLSIIYDKLLLKWNS